MSTSLLSRRRLVSSGAGFATGLFLPSRGVLTAQEGTPETAVEPLGFVSLRIRSVADAAQRDVVNQYVLDQFAPDVEALDGFQGYLLGDVIEAPEDSLSILVLDAASQQAAFNDLAAAFVEGISDEVQVASTQGWEGDLLIAGSAIAGDTTPEATGAAPATGYAAVRVHTSLPGTDPRDFVSMATDEFLPIVAGIDGFQGYLWFPTENGFAAVTLYDAEESAVASNDAAREWATEFLAAYTDGNPEVINANLVYANLPILS